MFDEKTGLLVLQLILILGKHSGNLTKVLKFRKVLFSILYHLVNKIFFKHSFASYFDKKVLEIDHIF